MQFSGNMAFFAAAEHSQSRRSAEPGLRGIFQRVNGDFFDGDIGSKLLFGPRVITTYLHCAAAGFLQSGGVEVQSVWKNFQFSASGFNGCDVRQFGDGFLNRDFAKKARAVGITDNAIDGACQNNPGGNSKAHATSERQQRFHRRLFERGHERPSGLSEEVVHFHL